MRLTQVSRQMFVGIDLPGQELGPAPSPLTLAVFFGLAELASFGEPSLKSHTGAGVGNTHRGICEVAEHSAMKCPHRIRVSRAGFEIDRRSTSTAACDGQTQ